MIFRESWVYFADGTNIEWYRVFHLYRGFVRRVTYEGLFMKGSVKVVIPPKLEYRGFKRKYYKKGDVIRSILVRTNWARRKIDHSAIFYKCNNAIMIKKKNDPRSKYFYGPVSTILNRKRFMALFSYNL